MGLNQMMRYNMKNQIDVVLDEIEKEIKRQDWERPYDSLLLVLSRIKHLRQQTDVLEEPESVRSSSTVSNTFDPDVYHCPKSCLCSICKRYNDCDFACETYMRMVNGCTDCDNCKPLIEEK
jgi:hypothetical protein